MLDSDPLDIRVVVNLGTPGFPSNHISDALLVLVKFPLDSFSPSYFKDFVFVIICFSQPLMKV
jgi:hypothetical protein